MHDRFVLHVQLCMQPLACIGERYRASDSRQEKIPCIVVIEKTVQLSEQYKSKRGKAVEQNLTCKAVTIVRITSVYQVSLQTSVFTLLTTNKIHIFSAQ